jgi:uncharacterized protein (TIGR02678 family)
VTALHDIERLEERRSALQELLAEPFVGSDDPAFRTIRRDEQELRRVAIDTFGYHLELTSGAARLVGRPTDAGMRRPIRVRPMSASGRARARDEWPALTDRACVLLFLTLAALERGGTQVAIADLAREVERAGADAQPSVPVDFRERAERVAFADGLDLLCAWGVLEHTAGSHESFSRAKQGEDEALLTVARRRLAVLLADPPRALAATTLAELNDDRTGYAPTPEGERRHRLHRLARRLVEDPVVVLDDLGEDDRQYFLGQRARIETAVADATGLAIERRAEGTACIVEGRELTDLPFPTNATVKQVALLLCDRLGQGDRLAPEAWAEAVRGLMAEHRGHWARDPDDPAEVAALAAASLTVLEGLDLVRVDASGAVTPQQVTARFRSPSLRRAGEPRR